MFVGFYCGRGPKLEPFFSTWMCPWKWLWNKLLKWMVRNDPDQMLRVPELRLLKPAAERGLGRWQM